MIKRLFLLLILTCLIALSLISCDLQMPPYTDSKGKVIPGVAELQTAVLYFFFCQIVLAGFFTAIVIAFIGHYYKKILKKLKRLDEKDKQPS